MKIARDQEVRIRLTLDQKQKLRFYAALVGKSMSEVVVEALASLEVPDEYKKRKHAIYQGPFIPDLDDMDIYREFLESSFAGDSETFESET